MFHKYLPCVGPQWFGDEQDRPCSCADEWQMHRTHCEWGQQMPDILCWGGEENGRRLLRQKCWTVCYPDWCSLRLKGGIINHFVVSTVGEEGPV